MPGNLAKESRHSSSAVRALALPCSLLHMDTRAAKADVDQHCQAAPALIPPPAASLPHLLGTSLYLLPPPAPLGLTLQIPQRYLMGPGPANADPRILAAQSLPLLGHM